MTDWTTPLCGCLDDCSVCCLGWFCPCCIYTEVILHLEGRYDCCRSKCCGVSSFNVRQIIRRRRNMEYECCNDCCAVTFCYFLANCQHLRELRKGNGVPYPGEGYYGSVAK
ncbi:putative Cys-rich domain containing protein [Trichomonas vaginalis G3]|uniref:Uncharacterized Cys-rich domain containing protein n=1 Tax=Trichomonas vaginalis (strain ATCC PRA-98 / G3) TaxID=412133 RepID=A2GKS3_TRIV3|nr:uncharacterized protein TVAGG3_0287910 [Trichomonas vaginalis G3]EAX82244.1 putative Cys-rich domain containing protein [Trichomonas vaginalis G3]KAI5527039.1 PLAC8 family [Trichomonas vaginalis G3]|eukprot:XP_001295174.1 hypothetical protein [Trichomonas vaginalis G3]